MSYLDRWFSYNRVSGTLVKSIDKGLRVNTWNWMDAPRRDLSFYAVAGRNGSALVDNGRFEDFQLTINVSLVSSQKVEDYIGDIRAWLLGATDYQTIAFGEGNNTPTKCRIGIFTGNIALTLTQLERYGTATLTFNCKPAIYDYAATLSVQRWVGTSGTYSFTNPSQILSAYPFICIYDSSRTAVTVTFNDTFDNMSLNIGVPPQYNVYINCENGAVWSAANLTADKKPVDSGLTGARHFPCALPGKQLTISITGATATKYVYITNFTGDI